MRMDLSFKLHHILCIGMSMFLLTGCGSGGSGESQSASKQSEEEIDAKKAEMQEKIDEAFENSTKVTYIMDTLQDGERAGSITTVEVEKDGDVIHGKEVMKNITGVDDENVTYYRKENGVTSRVDENGGVIEEDTYFPYVDDYEIDLTAVDIVSYEETEDGVIFLYNPDDPELQSQIPAAYDGEITFEVVLKEDGSVEQLITATTISLKNNKDGSVSMRTIVEFPEE